MDLTMQSIFEIRISTLTIVQLLNGKLFTQDSVIGISKVYQRYIK